MEKIVANFGNDLDSLVWTLAVGGFKPTLLQRYVKSQFATLIATTSDANQISQYDIESFLVAVIANVDASLIATSLPKNNIILKQKQRDF